MYVEDAAHIVRAEIVLMEQALYRSVEVNY